MSNLTKTFLIGAGAIGAFIIFSRVDDNKERANPPAHAQNCIKKKESDLGTGNIFYSNGCNVPINVGFCTTHGLTGKTKCDLAESVTPNKTFLSITRGNGSIMGELAATSGVTFYACVSPQNPNLLENNKFVCK